MASTAFYTFDPLSGVDVREAMSAIISNEVSARAEAISKLGPIADQRIKLHEDALASDPATLLFVLIIDQDENGAARPALEKNLGRDRLGRIPYGDGDPIRYLVENIVDNEGSRLQELLTFLRSGLSETACSEGPGGLELRGWLDHEDISKLISILRAKSWNVLSNEPIDGGVGDVCRHLIAHLKAAHRRHCGILMRAHT
jgi:hypothetical protein